MKKLNEWLGYSQQYDYSGVDEYVDSTEGGEKTISTTMQDRIKDILIDIKGHWGFSVYKEPYILTGNKAIGQRAEKLLNSNDIVAKLKTHKGSYIIAIDVDGDGVVDYDVVDETLDSKGNTGVSEVSSRQKMKTIHIIKTHVRDSPTTKKATYSFSVKDYKNESVKAIETHKADLVEYWMTFNTLELAVAYLENL